MAPRPGSSRFTLAVGGTMMRAPFGWSDEGTLRDLVAGAGFREVKLNRQAGVVRFGSARELVVAYGAGSPLAGAIRAAGPAARAGLLTEVQAALDPWQGAPGWPSRSRRCWSAAASRQRRGQLPGCLAGRLGLAVLAVSVPVTRPVER